MNVLFLMTLVRASLIGQLEEGGFNGCACDLCKLAFIDVFIDMGVRLN